MNPVGGTPAGGLARPISTALVLSRIYNDTRPLVLHLWLGGTYAAVYEITFRQSPVEFLPLTITQACVKILEDDCTKVTLSSFGQIYKSQHLFYFK